jgi:hypothetical protein
MRCGYIKLATMAKRTAALEVVRAHALESRWGASGSIMHLCDYLGLKSQEYRARLTTLNMELPEVELEPEGLEMVLDARVHSAPGSGRALGLVAACPPDDMVARCLLLCEGAPRIVPDLLHEKYLFTPGGYRNVHVRSYWTDAELVRFNSMKKRGPPYVAIRDQVVSDAHRDAVDADFAQLQSLCFEATEWLAAFPTLGDLALNSLIHVARNTSLKGYGKMPNPAPHGSSLETRVRAVIRAMVWPEEPVWDLVNAVYEKPLPYVPADEFVDRVLYAGAKALSHRLAECLNRMIGTYRDDLDDYDCEWYEQGQAYRMGRNLRGDQPPVARLQLLLGLSRVLCQDDWTPAQADTSAITSSWTRQSDAPPEADGDYVMSAGGMEYYQPPPGLDRMGERPAKRYRAQEPFFPD